MVKKTAMGYAGRDWGDIRRNLEYVPPVGTRVERSWWGYVRRNSECMDSSQWPPAGTRVEVSWDEPEPKHDCPYAGPPLIKYDKGLPRGWKLGNYYIEFCPFCGEKLE